jgi:hypothetical protein
MQSRSARPGTRLGARCHVLRFWMQAPRCGPALRFRQATPGCRHRKQQGTGGAASSERDGVEAFEEASFMTERGAEGESATRRPHLGERTSREHTSQERTSQERTSQERTSQERTSQKRASGEGVARPREATSDPATGTSLSREIRVHG